MIDDRQEPAKSGRSAGVGERPQPLFQRTLDRSGPASVTRTSSGAISPLPCRQTAQHSFAYLLGDRGDGIRCQRRRGSEAHGVAITCGRLKSSVDDAAMSDQPGADLGARQGTRTAKTRMVFVIVDVPVPGDAEAVEEAHRAEARVRGGVAGLAQVRLDDAQQDMQHGADCLRLALQVRAQPLGHREDPLAHRQGGTT